MALVLDRAAAKPVLEEADVQAWGSEQRVFVSSLISGYEDRRAGARRGIEAIGAAPVMFEGFGGRDGDPNQAYLDEVAGSTIYTGLLGERYGKPLPSRYSATHEEFRHAERQGLRISVWTEDGVAREGPQQSFLDEVRTFNVTGSFADPDDLAKRLEARLRTIAAEELSPWCRLGDAIFRAREITIAKERATIIAVVRDPNVIQVIEDLESGWGSEAPFVTPRGVYDAGINDLTSTMRAASTQELSIELELAEPTAPTEVTMNSVSWQEMTKKLVGIHWFEEKNDLGMMAAMNELSNPYPLVAELAPPEEAVRPLARLFAQEVLVRERGVRRLTQFLLGSSVGGRRHVLIGWQDPKRYTNEPAPDPVEVSGEIALG